jgi:hypothetical protein
MGKLTDDIRPFVFLRGVTGLTGGGATNLDGIETADLSVSTPIVGYVNIAGTISFYKLAAGTTAESSPTTIRPDDYAGGTNEKVWTLLAVGAGGGAPTAHQASHNSGGSDALKLDDLAAPDDNTDLNADATKHGLLKKTTGSATDVLRGDHTWGTVPSGGTPGTHATSHQSGGGDPIKLDDLAAPDDNTDLNADATKHGLLKKTTGSATDVLRGDHTWGASPEALRYRSIWIGAGSMIPRTSNGCAAAATAEAATNDIMTETVDFDGASQEFAQFNLAMPDEWDRSTVKVKVFWTPASGASAADTVEWGIKAGALSNDDAIDAALGSEVTVGDVVIAVGDVHVTSASGAVTVGGTPAIGDFVTFQISRNPAGTDDMTEDAKLLGVQIQYREGAPSSAW